MTRILSATFDTVVFNVFFTLILSVSIFHTTNECKVLLSLVSASSYSKCKKKKKKKRRRAVSRPFFVLSRDSLHIVFGVKVCVPLMQLFENVVPTPVACNDKSLYIPFYHIIGKMG